MTQQLQWLFLITVLSPFYLQAQNWRSFYNEVTELDSQLFRVNRFDKYGVVNNDGTIIIPAKYDTLISYPKGFIGKETKNEETKGFVFSKTGKIIYQTNSATQLLPYERPEWKDAENKIPLLRIVSGAFDTAQFKTIIPYKYLYTLPMGSSNTLFLIANEEEKMAVINSALKPKSIFQYSLIRAREKESKTTVEPIDKQTIPNHYYTNWVYREDTLVCLSSLTGKELWKSANQHQVICCDNGIHLVQPTGYNSYGEYTIIDEATQTITKLKGELTKIHTYVGNGLFYVSYNNGKHGLMNLNGELQKEYPYEAVAPVPRSGVISGLKAPNIDFGDYLYAKNDDGIFLWSPSSNHRMKIDNFYFQSLENYKLRPFAKSKRFWVLIRSEKFDYIEKGWNVDPVYFSELVICDSLTGKIVYTRKGYGDGGGIRTRDSSPDNDIWLINHQGSDAEKGFTLFDNGQTKDFQRTSYKRLSDDGRFYLMRSDNFGDRFYSRSKVYDVKKGFYVTEGIDDAVYFGEEENKVLAIKDSRSQQIYLADENLNKIKTVPIKGVYSIRKLDIENKPKNTLLSVRTRDDDYNYYSGVVNAEGDIVLAFDYDGVNQVYQTNGKYAFIADEFRKNNDEPLSGFFISHTGQKTPCITNYIVPFKQYRQMNVDSIHTCIFNFETGQVSPKYDHKENTIRMLKNKGRIYIALISKDKGTRIYRGDTFEPIASEAYLSPSKFNTSMLINFQTGEKKTDWHVYSQQIGAYYIIYKYIHQTIDWEGNCLEGCD